MSCGGAFEPVLRVRSRPRRRARRRSLVFDYDDEHDDGDDSQLLMCSVNGTGHGAMPWPGTMYNEVVIPADLELNIP